MDPPDHTRLRRLVARAFTPRAVERMRPRIEHIANELVDAMVTQGPPVDFVAAFAAPLPAFVISEMVGAPGKDHARLREWMDVALSIAAHTPRAGAAVHHLHHADRPATRPRPARSPTRC